MIVQINKWQLWSCVGAAIAFLLYIVLHHGGYAWYFYNHWKNEIMENVMATCLILGFLAGTALAVGINQVLQKKGISKPKKTA